MAKDKKKKKKKKSLWQRIKGWFKKKINGVVKYVAYKWILPRKFKKYSKEPIDENLVVFADRLDRPLQDNFKDMYELCKQNGYKCVVLTGQSFGASVKKKSEKRKAKIKFHYDFIKLYATCKCLFLVDFFPLAYIVKPRKGTQVVQLWHACGVMKKIGYSALDKPWGMTPKEAKRYPTHNTYTLVCASSHRPQETFIDAFRCDPDIVKPLGVPRTDIYFNKEFVANARKRVLEMYPEIGDRKIILYAPTYRGNSIKKSHMEVTLDFNMINQELGDKYAFLVKFHPITKKKGWTETERIRSKTINVTDTLTPEEALCAADILISDYSTIYFEYMLLERPIISYIYDLDEYIKDRGLYFPYDQLAPGPYVFDTEELIEAVKAQEEHFDIERLRKYKHEFMADCDGHSTERIFNYVFHPEDRQPNVAKEEE